MVARLSLRPVPIGRLRRLSVLGTLQAKIGAAYLFHWLRGWFKTADEQQRLLAETHWRTALRVLDSMSHLRGAVMKIGQTLANFPDIAPREFVETLEKFHFSAPPMHWSLLREMVHNELGDTPENLFAETVRRRYTRGRASSPTVCRCQFGWRAMFYLLKARIDVRSIAEEEVKATGWDRSDYADDVKTGT
jgi:hypothetical protein